MRKVNLDAEKGMRSHDIRNHCWPTLFQRLLIAGKHFLPSFFPFLSLCVLYKVSLFKKLCSWRILPYLSNILSLYKLTTTVPVQKHMKQPSRVPFPWAILSLRKKVKYKEREIWTLHRMKTSESLEWWQNSYCNTIDYTSCYDKKKKRGTWNIVLS